MRQPVKGTTAAGRRREFRARETRRRIIEAGVRLFLQHGYVTTTVQAIADEADVAVATIYQAFGTKQAILAAALDVTIAGDDAPLPLLDGGWVEAARHERDFRRRLRLIVEGAARVAARTAPLKDVMRDAAATDVAARQLVRQDHDRRHRTQEGLVDLLIEVRPLGGRLDRRRAIDTFFALVNSSTYDLLVIQQGWAMTEWQNWLTDIIEQELFGPPD
ncbi:MAG: TetR/AcrR family transcriptional regulator [Actinomycetota bacterium]|nr:TetR/AcrR family transcriptional regulator [Actinomycetota bacterium]